jgi:hypothetical protein
MKSVPVFGLAVAMQSNQTLPKEFLVEGIRHLVCRKDAFLQGHGDSFNGIYSFGQNNARTG